MNKLIKYTYKEMFNTDKTNEVSKIMLITCVTSQ